MNFRILVTKDQWFINALKVCLRLGRLDLMKIIMPMTLIGSITQLPHRILRAMISELK